MFRKKRVLVTGGQSMIGAAICQELQQREAYVDPVPHDEVDCLDINQVRERFELFEPDYVIHAAGWNGGIKWNRKHPAKIFYRTGTMALNVLGVAADKRVDGIVSLMASCSYPDKGLEVLEEKNMWEGLPNDSVECHGLSKRILHAFSRQITKELDIPTLTLVLTNCYGPGDSFHLDKTKVVGALIRKFVEAKMSGQNKVVVFGSGDPLREFMYSEDAGRSVVRAAESLLDARNIKDGVQSTLLNIGSGQEVSIRELTEVIAELVGYTGKIEWDTSKPDGQMKKLLRSDPLVELTPLREGLSKTIEWYKENKEYADNKEIK